MFGHNDHDDVATVNSTLSGHDTSTPPTITPDNSLSAPGPTVVSPTNDAPDDTPPDLNPTPAEPTGAPVTGQDLDAPEITATASDDEPSEDSSDEPADDDSTSPEDQALLDLKQQALQELTPLLGQLDHSPEERFKTTMMMIQATDSANLVQDAYDAAKEITDEKVRAQALLDIVNEINYFTQIKEKSA